MVAPSYTIALPGLAAHLARHGIKNRDLAAAIGVHPVAVSQWLHGHRDITATERARVALALGVDETDLFESE